MSHPEIIIPFALPPAEHAKDLVKLLASVCGTDGLAMLLSRSHTLQRTLQDDFSPTLPHESWLSKQHNPLTALQSELNLTLTDGYWFLLKPVNLHIASNHLVLTDYRGLDLSDTEARALFEIAASYCHEAGLELVYGNAANWLLRADDWSELTTASPDAACGHNIDIWLPQGAKARAWRKLQNDIQMEWFINPRQLQKPVNGLWLWSGTRIQAGAAAPTRLHADLSAAQFIDTPRLTLIDRLSGAALAGDWGNWAEIMQQLEHEWFKPLYAALKARQLHQVNLVLSNTTTLLHTQTSAGSVRRFWRSVHFNHLI